MDLTRDIARQRATVRRVVLDVDLTTYVRRLPGDMLAELVSAIGMPPAERARRLTALCVADADGAPMFADPAEAEGEIDEWPPVWLVKIADEAGQVNGLYVEGGDPEPEPDAP